MGEVILVRMLELAVGEGCYAAVIQAGLWAGRLAL